MEGYWFLRFELYDQVLNVIDTHNDRQFVSLSDRIHSKTNEPEKL